MMASVVWRFCRRSGVTDGDGSMWFGQKGGLYTCEKNIVYGRPNNIGLEQDVLFLWLK